VRRSGSAGVDLAYVACGRLDGFWEIGLSPWDMAAGILLIQEAGGSCSDMTGAPHHLRSPHILADNGMLHQELLEVFAATRRNGAKHPMPSLSAV
jgi:myo-inositol-1(or 4)-monophosphatase